MEKESQQLNIRETALGDAKSLGHQEQSQLWVCDDQRRITEVKQSQTPRRDEQHGAVLALLCPVPLPHQGISSRQGPPGGGGGKVQHWTRHVSVA